MERTKNIALVAHDNRKQDLIEWVEWNYQILLKHRLICTGTTGALVEKALNGKLALEGDSIDSKRIRKLKSGPLGGDQQLGALIAEGEIDLLIFLWDPMEPQPHDVDVKALLRIAVVYNIPTACNRATADFMISSPLLYEEYKPVVKNYTGYISRRIMLDGDEEGRLP
jgi:methylglyoxal synthase